MMGVSPRGVALNIADVSIVAVEVVFCDGVEASEAILGEISWSLPAMANAPE